MIARELDDKVLKSNVRRFRTCGELSVTAHGITGERLKPGVEKERPAKVIQD